jgi:hypothetical protein
VCACVKQCPETGALYIEAPVARSKWGEPIALSFFKKKKEIMKSCRLYHDRGIFRASCTGTQEHVVHCNQKEVMRP